MESSGYGAVGDFLESLQTAVSTATQGIAERLPRVLFPTAQESASEEFFRRYGYWPTGSQVSSIPTWVWGLGLAVGVYFLVSGGSRRR